MNEATRTRTKTVEAREYLRVSKDKSGRARSTSEQHVENARAASEGDWRLGEPYIDNDRSASRYATKVRDDFQLLIRDLEQDRFGADVLILWESSRGSRKVGEWVEMLDLCEQRGVRVHVTTHARTYDPANHRDRRSLLEDAVDSEYESGKISTRARRAQAAQAEAGLPNGRCPVGYVRRYDPVTRRLVAQEPDPQAAPMIRELFERIARGHSLRAIARDYEQRGIVNAKGVPYSSAHLRTLALTHAYTGLRVHVPGRSRTASIKIAPEHIREAAWEPLVDRDLFWKVQDILSAPERVTTRPGRANHLLSMIAVCDVCRGPLAARRGTRSDGSRPPQYTCHRSGHVKISEPDLDRLAEDTILNYLQGEALGADLAEAEADTSSELAAIRDELADLSQRRAGIADALATGLAPDLAASADRKILQSIEALQARERELATPPRLRGLVEPGPGVDERWKGLTMDVKRQIVRIVLTPDALGELRVIRSPRANRSVPVEERVRFGDNG